MNDKSKVFKDKIQKQVQEIAQECIHQGIPFFMAFATGDDSEKKGRLKLETLPYIAATAGLPETLNIETDDRRFADFVNVLNGFETVPPHDKSNFEVDMADLMPDFPDDDYIPEEAEEVSEEVKEKPKNKAKSTKGKPKK
ncbi:hypothetical protein bpr_II291 (plasmid) [Butyrivibrio proteoclasticus B316]|uniref:Uncharacterized protein n=1 Tax=Butyrivibrio proteoclasticus (strain ATCC 51982 / DSM 14932 / B316) TaxID=515622 RepID=E0S496_BUTPB|nr:hypothetical protein [Butyrivibrio proteoclasticus]ADL36228.1 hypothetical protein bpr_II291 [Butyrivibrio proteoclasticus B316]